jgi:hypothetical protein
MTLSSNIDMRSAVEVFMVSNTPLFLLRKLKALPVINEIKKLPERELMSELRKALKRKPTIVEDYVLPYLFLISIAEKGNAATLAKALSLPAPHHSWYAIVGDAIAKSFRSTSIEHFPMPNVIPQSALSDKSEYQTSISKLEFPGS